MPLRAVLRRVTGNSPRHEDCAVYLSLQLLVHVRLCICLLVFFPHTWRQLCSWIVASLSTPTVHGPPLGAMQPWIAIVKVLLDWLASPPMWSRLVRKHDTPTVQKARPGRMQMAWP